MNVPASSVSPSPSSPSYSSPSQVLHAHVVRGSQDNSDFKSQKIPFTRDNQYMIAAYNYSLAEIEVPNPNPSPRSGSLNPTFPEMVRLR